MILGFHGFGCFFLTKIYTIYTANFNEHCSLKTSTYILEVFMILFRQTMFEFEKFSYFLDKNVKITFHFFLHFFNLHAF